MTSDEFLDTAHRLAAGGTEGDWRSAVSRAYYAIFHFFRVWLEANGTSLGTKDNVHQNLCEGLVYSGIAEVQSIGQEVDRLRTRRKQADYDFGRTIAQRDARIAVARAEQILTDFNAITSVPPGTIADGVRDFLVRANRLPPPTP